MTTHRSSVDPRNHHRKRPRTEPVATESVSTDRSSTLLAGDEEVAEENPGAEDRSRAGKKDARSTHQNALRRTLRTIRPHLREHWLLMLLGLLALIADVIFRVLEPWPMKFVIDGVTASLGADLSDAAGVQPATAQLLVTWAIILAAIVAGRALANYASTICFAFVGSRVATSLRSRVFEHVQSLSLRYHSKASVGDTSQRLVGDIGRLQEVAVTAGLPLVGNVLTLIVLTVVMVWLDPLLSVIVLLAAAAYLFFSRTKSPRITQASRKTRKGEGKLVGSAAEALGAIRVVQAYGLESTVAANFRAGNAVALSQGIKARRLAAALERSTDVIVGIATAAVLALGGWQVMRQQITPGDLVLFMMYLKIAMKPLRDMAKYTGRIARAAASGERIADLMDERVEIQDLPGARDIGRVDGDLAFHQMSARDGHGRPLFKDFSFHIPAGQRVAVLGPSGAGKSTLASYVLRLADPESGQILLDGYDIGRVTRASLRSQVSILLQESVLFATTVRENIRFGRMDAADLEVEAAAKRAGAHEFIMALPEGYDTKLGQRGDTLSGGQRQRIAIARAMLRNAPVVILDEATTGLDPASKALVESSLRDLTRNRTTLVITHDLSTIRDLDRVVWLEDGQLIEDGRPELLLGDPDSQLSRWVAQHASAADPVEASR